MPGEEEPDEAKRHTLPDSRREVQEEEETTTASSGGTTSLPPMGPPHFLRPLYTKPWLSTQRTQRSAKESQLKNDMWW